MNEANGSCSHFEAGELYCQIPLAGQLCVIEFIQIIVRKDGTDIGSREINLSIDSC